MAGSKTVGGSLQTPYVDAAISDVNQAGEGVGARGGRDTTSPVSGVGLVSSPYDEAILTDVSPVTETPNPESGLSQRVDGASLGTGDPGESGQVPLPNLDESNVGRTLA